MKLYRHLTLCAAMALPMLASAVPAMPGIIRAENPDGSVIEVRHYGDEFFSYVTDAEGHNILERDASGFWRKATRGGSFLEATPSNIEMLRAEKLAPVEAKTSRPARMAALDRDGRSLFPCEGEVHSLVILLEFDDTKFSVEDPQAAFTKMLNEEGYSDYGSMGSARDYYMFSSNNKFKPIFDVTRPVTLKNKSRFYTGKGLNPVQFGSLGPGQMARFGYALQEAIIELDSEIDFTEYDYDNDGIVDNIFFFFAGYGQNQTLDDTMLWPHQGKYTYYIDLFPGDLYDYQPDGMKVRSYACSNELTTSKPSGWGSGFCLDGIGTFCHEFGHVLGLPDLYDVKNDGTKNPEAYSIMATGSYNVRSTCPPAFSAYERWLCNWLEFEDAEEGESYDIASLSSPSGSDPSALRMRIKRTAASTLFLKEFFVAETRTHDNWDASLPEEGLFIWRVNFDSGTWSSNQVNVSKKPHVELFESSLSPVTYAFPKLSYLCFGMDIYPIPQSSPHYFNPNITGISFDTDKKSSHLDYNVIAEQPQVEASFLTPVLNEDGDGFILRWESPDAEAYTLSLYRTNTSGRDIVIDNLTDTFMGAVTEYEVTNQSQASMKQKYTATLRGIKGLPSKEISAQIEFVPDDLAGVGSIGQDNALTAFGGRGEITAPEGARVFTLSGCETGTTGLPAGVYIVRLGGKSVKVVVK